MSENDVAIKVQGLSKCYQIYNTPRDRLKQFVAPRLQRLVRQKPRHYFNAFWALKDVSFDIKRGETVGIIGRNGSGKSTLLQMICGTLTPTEGSIQTRGRIAALLELGSGFDPQFTGRENIYMNAAVLGLSKKEIDARYDDIVAFADIGHFIEQPVKTYSSGMTVRLAFSVIAHVDADILVIDEALAVGDAYFGQKCMRFLRNFMKTGTVLFVSHSTESIKSLCSRVVWLEKGTVIEEGTPKAVCERYLEAFYEANQGKSTTTKIKLPAKPAHELPTEDQRLKYINASNLRNDLQVFAFNPDAQSFGKMGAQIEYVALLNENDRSLAWIVGGEKVTLRIMVRVNKNLAAPIVGFFIKDHLGQNLFGDNTHLPQKETPVYCKEGQELQANFVFYMPILPAGNYSITAAIADGDQQSDCVQHHWVHDAVLFTSESSSVSTGIIGIPMLSVTLR